jgi:curved DNA-binding protein CbpA
MHLDSETAVFNACRTLFGKEVNLSRDFLNYLQPSGAKNAFRSQAKVHHPDAHASSSKNIRNQQTERFREIRQAYDLIIEFLENRHVARKTVSAQSPSQTPSHRGRAKTQKRKQQKPHARPSKIPSIPLEFGMYSYYHGKVSYQQLIEALVWQRRQRPTLGALAQKWGWLSDIKVSQVLQHRGHAARFGKKAIELGYLRPYQVDALLKHQRSLQTRLGHYFVEKGLLTEEEADQISANLKNHNSQLKRRTRNRANSRL